MVLRKSFWFEIAADGLVGLKKRLALVFSRKQLVSNWFAFILFLSFMTLMPNKTLEPTAESTGRLAQEVRVRHTAVRLWLSFFR